MKFLQTTLLGLALLLSGLTLCGFGLWLLLSPPQYQATARINPSEPSEPPDNGSFDPYFIQTSFEIIQSEVVLSNVVTGLRLDEVWSDQFAGGHKLSFHQTLGLLRSRLVLQPVRDTMLIDISFTSTDPDEAAKVANAIAGAYRNYRIETLRGMMAAGLETRQIQYDQEEKQIQLMQTNVDHLRRNFANIGDPTASNGKPYPEAKLELDQMIQQHKLLKIKIDTEKSNEVLPKDQMVQIINPAVPPKSSIRPNRYLGGAVLALGLILSFGGIILLKPKD